MRWYLASTAIAVVIGLALIFSDSRPSATPGLAPTPSATGLIYPDGENYFDGHYTAYASDWSAALGQNALRRGVDYRDTIVVRPETFPANTDIHWSWPHRPPTTSGVYGYMHIAFGYYAGQPEQPIVARRVADISVLKARYAVSSESQSGGHNVLSETFLTREKDDFETRALEVGFLTELSPHSLRFFRKARPLGSWTDPDGVAWRVAVEKEYVMFVPEAGVLDAGLLHFDEAFRWLDARGEMPRGLWFNGLAIGVEPVGGSGTMRIEDWFVEYR